MPLSLVGPHEKQIDERLDRLDPHAFQKLAEDYTRIRFPERWSALIPIGRNTTSTIRNWPDAQALSRGGLHLMEATRSDEWSGHLAGDLEELRKHRDRIASFVYVAWAANPRDSLVQDRYREIADLGIDVDFVFRSQLVADLAQPRYAPIWPVLGFPTSGGPLQLLGDAPLFGDDTKAAFKPTREEYVSGDLVHRPAVFDDVLAHLRTGRVAVVRGKGASGKTSLATSVAFSSAYYAEGAPHLVYYLDLSRWHESGLHEAFTTRCDGARLIIVDNVHVRTDAAEGLYRTWRKLETGAHLLLLGRSVEVTNVRGDRMPLRDVPAVELQVYGDDLVGVYRRLMLRAGRPPEKVPLEEVDKWLQTFGGDLVAFSLAVTRSLQRLGPGRWTLLASDARDYVAEQYLAEVSPAERETLLRMAATAELEVPTPRSVLDVEPPAALLANGIVTREHASRDLLYSFVHPGFGELFAAAMNCRDLAPSRRTVVERSPFTAILLADRGRRTQRLELAAEILRFYLDESRWPEVMRELGMVARLCRAYEETGVLTREEFEKRVLPFVPSLIDRFRDWYPSTYRGSLHELRAESPRLFEAFKEMLSSTPSLERWLDWCVACPAEELVSFLLVAHEYFTEDGFRAADRYLARRAPAIVQSCMDTESLWRLRNLSFSEFRHLAKALRQAFERDSERLLAFARRTLAAGTKTTTSSVLGTVRFLQSGGRTDAAQQLLQLFDTPEVLDVIVNRSFDNTPRLIVSLEGDLGPEWVERAVAGISLDLLLKKKDALIADTLGKILRLLDRHGRRADAMRLAQAIVEDAGEAIWERRGFYLVPLATVIQLSHDLPAEKLARFLDVALAPGRLAPQLERAATGPLVGSVLALWAHPAVPVERLRIPELQKVLLSRLSVRTPFADVARVAAACRLLGMELPPYPVDAVGDVALGEVIRADVVSPAGFVAGPELQFWVGLRELARQRSTPWLLDAELGDAISAKWAATLRENGRLKALDATMCAWLGRCAAASWRLVSDDGERTK